MKDFDDLAGVEILELRDNEGYARVKLREESFNSIKSVHGGLMMTLADTVAGNFLIKTTGRIATTTQCSFNFLKPCFGGKYIFAKARLIKEGKNVSTVSTEIFNDQKELLAVGTFVFFHFNKDIERRN